jgi:hypothetical protein
MGQSGQIGDVVKSERLIQFTHQMGFEDEMVFRSESIHNVHLHGTVDSSIACDVPVESYEAIANAFGSSLNLTLGLGEEVAILSVRDNDFGNLGRQIDRLRAIHNGTSLNFDLVVDKRVILSTFRINDEIQALFYLFRENLLKFLELPLPRLERELFDGTGRPLLIVVSEDGAEVSTPLFNIVAEANVWDLDFSSVLEKAQRYEAVAEACRKAASEELRWAGFNLEVITPVHFLTDSGENLHDDCSRQVFFNLIQTSLVYSANRSQLVGGSLICYFDSPERSTQIDPIGCTAADLGSYQAVARMALWPFRGRVADRLGILQNVVSREIGGDDPKENCTELLQKLSKIMTDATWHHRQFIDGEIDRHFKDAEEVSKYGQGVARDIATSLDSITRSFTETLLGTIGVVVLTLIAALVKDGAQTQVFKVGMIAYALYVMLFQILYRLGSAFHGYLIIRSDISRETEYFMGKLGKSRLSRLMAPVLARRRQFLAWYWLTVLIYLLVVRGMMWLAFNVPGWLVTPGP